jgi:para-aminobenzoate synthetase / 4-amino-4-deoxychorismate lyase
VRALLFHSPDGWLSLERPSEIVVARTIADVRPCLQAAEAAARRGAYAAGFVSYEAGAAFGLAVQPAPKHTLPLAWFAIVPASNAVRVDPPVAGTTPSLAWTADMDRDAYVDAIDRVRAHIADGDTYQLNFTFRLRTSFTDDPRALFGSLVAAQHGAWSAYLDLGSHAICSASPELFFRLDRGVIECRPMKGTMPRGLWPAADLGQAERLRASPKNQSENVMIVDLMRSDLGRIARVGTVDVVSLFDVERYPAQWQMTSSVRADVHGVPMAEIFASLFPSGSVTGAPKTRSMEIIRDLETSPRGIYTGAIGLIGPSGDAHFNVAIRTVVVDRERGEAEFGVGSGVVWESDAQDEFDECRVKASILTSRLPDFELLETLKWDPSDGFVLLERHLERLMASAAYFDIPCSRDTIMTTMNNAIAGRRTPTRARLLLSRAGRARCEATDLSPLPPIHTIALAAAPVSRSDVFLYHKTTHRIVHERARASRPDVDEVLLWNEDGEITEAINANVVVEIEGQRMTPPIASGLLPGTMRAELVTRGDIVEGVIRTTDLSDSSRIWLINSVRGWMATMRVPAAMVLGLLLIASTAFAQGARPAPADRPTKHARAVRIPQGRIVVDGTMSEEEWRQADALTDFMQQEPSEGQPALFRSEVRFLYDDEMLYMGAKLFDDRPDKLVTNELKHDFSPRENDMFGITLDTFHDKLNGYGFFTIPKGARRDSQVADDGRANNQSWDAVWNVRTSVVDDGWIIEYGIPFKSLRFPKADVQLWGLNIVRVERRTNEISAWNFVPRSFPLSKPSFAGVLEGIEGVKPGRDIRIKPFGIVSGSRRAGAGKADADGGVDLKTGIGTSLVLDGTFRTDFAQVEADEQQINLTRFSLFYPEKREFFLENQRAFQINSSLAGNNLVPFFSRRIGLSDAGEEIPLIGGARLSGKQGRSTIGALNITTEKQARPGQLSLPRSNYSFARYGRDFLNNSSASAFYMGHERSGASNRVVGSDLQLNVHRRLVIDGLVMHSDTRGIEPGVGTGGGTALRGGFDFDSSLTRVAASYTSLDASFRNDLGFIQRPGRDILTGVVARGIRPSGDRARIVREYTPGLTFTRFTRDGLGTETRSVSPNLALLFADASTASVALQMNEEAIEAPFRINPAHTIPVGRYRFNQVIANGRMTQAHRLALNGELRAGSFWDGTRYGFTAGGRFRANAHLATTLNFTRDMISAPGASFNTNLVSLRVDGSFTTRMFLNAFIQYNSVTREVLSNVRFNVIHRPLSDLFVVYNEARPTVTAPVSRAVTVKLTQMVSF